jgi:hypothetical protein
VRSVSARRHGARASPRCPLVAARLAGRRGSSPEDEAGGSSPPRPTTGPDQWKCRQRVWSSLARRVPIKELLPGTVACPGPDGYEPRVSTSQNGWMRASPKVCVGPPTALVLVAGSRHVGPLSEVLSSLLAMTSRSVAANTTSWISQNAGHPQADEIASFDQHRSPNLAQGLSAGHRWGKASCWV